MEQTAGESSRAYDFAEVRRLREELAKSHATIIETLKTLVAPEQRGRLIRVGNVTLDARRMAAWIDGARAHLPYVKFHMLLTLSRQDGAIVPIARLLEHSRRETDDANGLAAAHISQLRRFLTSHRANVVIESVRYAGYRLSHNEPEQVMVG
jgi:DNA-binding response OmpR family regulator